MIAENAYPRKVSVRIHLLLRCLIVLLGCATIGTAATPPDKVPDLPPLLLGAAWYPEQWPESRWERDLELMQEAHIHVVRVGEFAWSRMEPTEGQYDFDWLERAINLAGKHQIFVVLGTPTATPNSRNSGRKNMGSAVAMPTHVAVTHRKPIAMRRPYRPTQKRGASEDPAK